MKNKLSILLALFCISITFYQSPAQEVSKVSDKGSKEVTLEDMWLTYRFYPAYVSGLKSMKDGLHYTTLEEGKISKFSYKSGELVETFLDEHELTGIPAPALEDYPDPTYEGQNKEDVEENTKISIDDYYFSNDEKLILISCNTEAIYRHSTRAQNYVYKLENGQLISVAGGKKQQLATFSPDGKLLAYVRDNNIFLFDIESGNERQITQDGEINKVLNGIPDWVYEEEFSFSQAFEWSPDGKKIAFIRFDESKVKEYDITMYGELYPELMKYKYPKAGEDNSLVSVHVYDLSTNRFVTMDVGTEKDVYIPRIKWTSDPNQLSIIRLNRLQNKMDLLFADAVTGKSAEVYSEQNKYYIDITDNFFILKDNRIILTSERDGYYHIYLVNPKSKDVMQLTKGTWDVVEIEGIDEKNGLIYYVSAESSPMNRDLYSVNLNGKNKTKIHKGDGSTSADYSATFDFCIETYSDASTPPVISVTDSKGNLVRIMEDNSRLVERMKDYRFCKKEFFSFKTDEGVELNGWMIKPCNFTKSRKYPVFMTCYGGPGSNTVNNKWEYYDLWYQHLAGKGYIVVSVDNRGTAYRGEEFKKSTYLQLGKLETEDQIAAAKYLGTLGYVDKDRIGIYGWSYGGYLSSLCLLKGSDVFKMAVAVAPVTNWRYYDNIYTERFMRKPQDNPEGYDSNSPINYVKQLKGKYLIVHGSADDNVHFQNTMEMIDALNNANKQYEMHIYPNKNHGIFGGITRYHLFTRMTNFILENL